MPRQASMGVQAKEPITTCSTLEIAQNYGKYFMYASSPKTVMLHRPATLGGRRPRGVHDYHCMMWDPRIYRGSTFKTFKRAEDERCSRKGLEDSRKAMGRRQRTQRDERLNGLIRVKTPPHTASKTGLESMGIQTDKFLEELTDEVQQKDATTQTEKAFDLPVPIIYLPVKMGLDVETQILPWELFNFDQEVAPIVSSVVGRVIEQALFETMEEAELESLLLQQRAFEDRRRLELLRLERLQKRQQKLASERGALIVQRQEEMKEEKEMQNIVGASVFSNCVISGLTKNVTEELRKSGVMCGNERDLDPFTKWMNENTMRQHATHDGTINLLDEIIQMVVNQREAQVADGIWREMSAENVGPSYNPYPQGFEPMMEE